MDARSLLRAKKAEARIEHPYAAYSARGELRCSVCAVPVKQWDAHLLTKQHRTSAAREKAEQAQRAAKSASIAKRTATDDGASAQAGPSKRAKTGPAGLPEGFFSKGNEVAYESDEEDEVEEDGGGGPRAVSIRQTAGGASTSALSPASNPAALAVQPTGDTELDDFFASLAAPDSDGRDPGSMTAGQPSVYTVQGNQPRKNVPKYKEIEPGQASYEAAPVRIVPADDKEEEAGAVPEETEKEKRDRLDREEREEIVRRLEEEERAQEDADSRVSNLKERMALLKKKREAKAGGASAATSAASGTAPKAGVKIKAKVNGADHA